ncbi:hypothetical protein AVEN_183946-1 [Araneus ventricosus]|uniref:Reverse transcriptase/retrotransposon-derived protein RNase H-like domain-containing protein n=1 Tax=Araneus ventricosus TaxID=182803 RepID=A0A4Y2E2I0_ARAVE|nr:hypothetical protein AVEN_183946-1 [Araneus ventricosus]
MQRYIDSVIRNISSFYAYVDDLLTASTDQESQKSDLDIVFSKVVNPQKCAFVQSELKFLDAAKEQACLHSLVKNKVKKDNTRITWMEDNQSAFDSCKRLIANSTTSTFPAADARLSLMTYASNFSVGAVLQQHIEPLGFFSKKLSATEKNIVLLAVNCCLFICL